MRNNLVKFLKYATNKSLPYPTELISWIAGIRNHTEKTAYSESN